MTLREAPTLVAAAGQGLVNTRPTMQSDAGQNDEIKVVFVDAPMMELLLPPRQSRGNSHWGLGILVAAKSAATGE
jgi:hypothetical protein